MTAPCPQSATPRVGLLLLWCAIGLGMGAAYAFIRPAGTPARDNDLESATVSITPPNPELTPDEVVRLQLDSLRSFRDDELALLQCFVLASPANRAATGPFNRFATMVRSPKYVALVIGESELVGKAVVRGDRATVLVTVVGGVRRAGAFRFFLSKQTEDPYRDCWMTDAVTPDTGKDEPPEPLLPSVAVPRAGSERIALVERHLEVEVR